MRRDHATRSPGRWWTLGVAPALALSLLWLPNLPGCTRAEAVEQTDSMRVLLLGFDGMDPILLDRFMQEGKMPNFQVLAQRGSYRTLATAMPPQSPVAWSNVICGGNPGDHELYDFIHRKANPDEDLPITLYLSISETQPAPVPWYKALFPETVRFGKWRLPIHGGEQPVLLRRGLSFWDFLVAHGIDTTIYRMPANYPPPNPEGPGMFRCLCGMGTPDILGTEGMFTEFREDLPRNRKSVSGGRFLRVTFDESQRAESVLEGPPNPYLAPDEKGRVPDLTVPVQIVRDPDENSAMIRIADQTVVLAEGMWSDWVRFAFDTGFAGQSIHAVVKLYLRHVRRPFMLYVTPMNIDPQNPLVPISTPPEFAAQVASVSPSGAMYTSSIPEQGAGKALRAKPQGLTEDEMLSMVQRLVEERTQQYRAALRDFRRGFLFFYFGHTDMLAHHFWRDIDPGHPGRLPEQEGKYDKVIENAYRNADDLLGEALRILDDNDVIIVMSDHGFASFRRGFNLNTWLYENGYLSLRSLSKRRRENYLNIDFRRSQAYAVGINSLYINLQGREKYGIVPPAQKRALMEEIAERLLQVRDEDGSRVIEKVYIVEDFYPNADPQIAPDMLVGYARNYRASWATALGGQPEALIEDNHDRWSGDHCIAAHLVPGILLTNRQVQVDDPTLSDIAPTVLGLFDIAAPSEMRGRNLFAPPRVAHAR